MTDDGGIRASDSDREHVVEILRDAYSAGRLTMAEFDERTTRGVRREDLGRARACSPRTCRSRPARTEPARAGPQRGAPDQPRPLPAGQSRRRLSPMLPILVIWLRVALTTGHPAAFIPVLVPCSGWHPGLPADRRRSAARWPAVGRAVRGHRR